MTDPLAVKRTSPLKMMSPLIVFLLIAAAWSGWWFYARGQAQDRLAAFEANTLALNCASRDWGGYPGARPPIHRRQRNSPCGRD